MTTTTTPSQDLGEKLAVIAFDLNENSQGYNAFLRAFEMACPILSEVSCQRADVRARGEDVAEFNASVVAAYEAKVADMLAYFGII